MRERTWSMNFVRWNWVFCHLDKEISVHEIRKRKEIINFCTTMIVHIIIHGVTRIC